MHIQHYPQSTPEKVYCVKPVNAFTVFLGMCRKLGNLRSSFTCLSRPKCSDLSTVQLDHKVRTGLLKHRPFHVLCAAASRWCLVMIVPAPNTFAARACARSADKGARWVCGSLTRPVLARGA